MRVIAGAVEAPDEYEDAGGPVMSQDTVVDAPEGYTGPGKTGLNDSDVVALVRLVKGGRSWEQAKRAMGGKFAPGVLDGWKLEVLRRAGRSGPVMPEKAAPRPAPVKREALDVSTELDIALAALVAGRGDLAMRVLRGLGAEATRAPEGWIDILMERNARASAPRPAPVRAAPLVEEEAGEEAAPAPPSAPRRAPRAAKGKPGRKPKAAAAAEPQDGRTE